DNEQGREHADPVPFVLTDAHGADGHLLPLEERVDEEQEPTDQQDLRPLAECRIVEIHVRSPLLLALSGQTQSTSASPFGLDAERSVPLEDGVEHTAEDDEQDRSEARGRRSDSVPQSGTRARAASPARLNPPRGEAAA